MTADEQAGQFILINYNKEIINYYHVSPMLSCLSILKYDLFAVGIMVAAVHQDGV